jgi:hypothetical protein
LIDGRETRDRILNEFYTLGYEELPFLQRLGYYRYEFEDSEYTNRTEAEIMIELKSDACALLQEIEMQEAQFSGFKSMILKTVRMKIVNIDGILEVINRALRAISSNATSFVKLTQCF